MYGSEVFEFVDVGSGQPIARKQVRAGMEPENWDLPGVGVRRAPGTDSVVRAAVPHELAAAKIDFLYSMSLQVQLCREKVSELFSDPVWRNLEPKPVLEPFLRHDQEAVLESLSDFWEQLLRNTKKLSTREELLHYRRYVADNFALGILNPFRGGPDEELHVD